MTIESENETKTDFDDVECSRSDDNDDEEEDATKPANHRRKDSDVIKAHDLTGKEKKIWKRQMNERYRSKATRIGWQAIK